MKSGEEIVRWKEERMDRNESIKQIAQSLRRHKEQAANNVAQVFIAWLVDAGLVTAPSSRKDVLEEKLTELLEEEL